MSGQDGIFLITHIRKNKMVLKNVAMSGDGSHYLDLAQGFQLDAILKKPFLEEQLIEKLSSIGIDSNTNDVNN